MRRECILLFLFFHFFQFLFPHHFSASLFVFSALSKERIAIMKELQEICKSSSSSVSSTSSNHSSNDSSSESENSKVEIVAPPNACLSDSSETNVSSPADKPSTISKDGNVSSLPNVNISQPCLDSDNKNKSSNNSVHSSHSSVLSPVTGGTHITKSSVKEKLDSVQFSSSPGNEENSDSSSIVSSSSVLTSDSDSSGSEVSSVENFDSTTDPSHSTSPIGYETQDCRVTSVILETNESMLLPNNPNICEDSSTKLLVLDTHKSPSANKDFKLVDTKKDDNCNNTCDDSSAFPASSNKPGSPRDITVTSQSQIAKCSKTGDECSNAGDPTPRPNSLRSICSKISAASASQSSHAGSDVIDLSKENELSLDTPIPKKSDNGIKKSSPSPQKRGYDLISPSVLNTNNKVSLVGESENNRNIRRKVEGFPRKHEQTTEVATHQFATRCDTNEGINYDSATDEPTVYTRITLNDIRSEIRNFFGEFTSPRYKEFHKVDADFLVSFCKWNINKHCMPTTQQIQSFLRDIGIRYDKTLHLSYFNPPSQFDTLVYIVTKNVGAIIFGANLRRDFQPSQNVSTWLPNVPAPDRTIIQQTSHVPLQPLRNRGFRGNHKRHKAMSSRNAHASPLFAKAPPPHAAPSLFPMPPPPPGGFLRPPFHTLEKPPSILGETKKANENVVTKKQVASTNVCAVYGSVVSQNEGIPESHIVLKKKIHH